MCSCERRWCSWMWQVREILPISLPWWMGMHFLLSHCSWSSFFQYRELEISKVFYIDEFWRGQNKLPQCDSYRHLYCIKDYPWYETGVQRPLISLHYQAGYSRFSKKRWIPFDPLTCNSDSSVKFVRLVNDTTVALFSRRIYTAYCC